MKFGLLTLLLPILAAAQSGLPPIGAEVPHSMLAINSALRIRTSQVSVDLRGGIKERVEENPQDPINSVRLRVVGFRVTAELPSSDGDEGGTVVIEQNDVDVAAKSTLKLTQRFPPRYEHTNLFTVTLTIDRPSTQRLVLVSKYEMETIGTITQYPARGDLYRLVNPVEFVDPEDHDTVIATLLTFPAKRGGL